MEPNKPRGRVKAKQCFNPWGHHKGKIVTRGLREVLPGDAVGVDALLPFVGNFCCHTCIGKKVAASTDPASLTGPSNLPLIAGSELPHGGTSTSAFTSVIVVPEIFPSAPATNRSEDVSVPVPSHPSPPDLAGNNPLSVSTPARDSYDLPIGLLVPPGSESADIVPASRSSPTSLVEIIHKSSSSVVTAGCDSEDLPSSLAPPGLENIDVAGSNRVSPAPLLDSEFTHRNNSSSLLASAPDPEDLTICPLTSKDANVAGTSGLSSASVDNELMNIRQCSFGHELKETCSLDKLPQPVKELPVSECNALLWSSNIWSEMPKDATVCRKHFDQFVGFALKPSGKTFPGCCNPFQKHFSTVTYELRSVNAVTVVKGLKVNLNLSIGDPICGNCRNDIHKAAEDEREKEELASSQSQSSHGQSQSTPLFFSPSIEKGELNQYMENLGLSPVIPPHYTHYGKVNYAKRKLEEVESVVKKKNCLSLGINEIEVQCDKVEDAQSLQALMDAVKKKIHDPSTDRPTRLQLLTLCPESWSERKASNFFDVSRHTIKRSRTLGLLERPPPRKGRTLPQAVKNAVLAFYCHDDNSRIMPGKKDYVSMGGGQHEQKRLLLCSLSELYNKFRGEYPLDKYPDLKIGFSQFCVLRPKYCVLAGASGTHNVCVCVLHQNLKLKLWALGIRTKLKELIPKFVCSAQNRNCLLALCPDCPKLNNLIDTLKSEVKNVLESEEDDVDAEILNEYLNENIEYSEWTSTDRSELLTKQSTVEDLITEVAKSLRKVIAHDFVSYEQSQYLNKKKAELTSGQAIVLMDFSMNYSCLIQDATQGYHWSKKQCTVHPTVIYYKGEDNKVAHKSLCFISPDIDHDVSLVQEIQAKTMSYIGENFPHIKEVMYMTDGCAAQYKNCKSFAHLTKHEELYKIKASWCFFATSHGKSASDGIGGLVKRAATLESLRRPFNNQIVNAEKLYEFCESSNLSKSIKFFFIKSEDVVERRKAASASNLTPVTIPGTRSFHHFFPLTDSNIGCKRVSSDDELSLIHPAYVETTSDEEWVENLFVAVSIGSKIYIGLITDTNPAEKEADLALLFPPLPTSTLTWSEDIESYIAPFPDLISLIQLKELRNNSYEFPVKEILNLRLKVEAKKKELRKKTKKNA